MARHRQPAAPRPPATVPEVPARLRLGPLVELWGNSDGDVFGARRAWAAARKAWVDGHGLPDDVAWRLLPDRRPWSLTEPDGDARLAHARVTRADIERLRHGITRRTLALWCEV